LLPKLFPPDLFRLKSFMSHIIPLSCILVYGVHILCSDIDKDLYTEGVSSVSRREFLVLAGLGAMYLAGCRGEKKEGATEISGPIQQATETVPISTALATQIPTATNMAE